MSQAGGQDNVFQAHISFGLDGCGSHQRYNGASYFDTGNNSLVLVILNESLFPCFFHSRN